MLKKLMKIPGVLALLAGLAASVSAQQLYVKDIRAVYPLGNAEQDDHYCQDGYDAANDANVSFVTEADTNGDGSFEYVSPEDWSARIETEHPRPNGTLGSGENLYPGGCLKLCVQIVCVSTSGAFGVDELTFDVFKFGAGSNPLDPASTPPIKTISLYNIGTCNNTNYPTEYVIGGAGKYYCAAWDGTYNLNGIFGKTNGQYGFRAKVKTNQVSPTAGNISIEQTSAYPGENQKPITVDVVNVHSVRSSPTVVGRITGVAAQPYNIQYRLSKDASATIKIFAADDANFSTPVRSIIAEQPRVGEGTPNGSLTNGDFWDGRDDTGAVMPSGVYVAFINAHAFDYYGDDRSYGATTYIALDPLIVTDIALRPLGASATDLATISYMLTEAATVYVGIYTPGTSFANLNDTSDISVATTPIGGTLLRSMIEQKRGRETVSTFWDGRDNSGSPVCDGNYVYAIYAEIPSPRGVGGTIRTRRLYVGTIPVSRGNVVALLNYSSTVIGSSPAVSQLDPFYFRYTPVRDTLVTLNIKETDGNSLVRSIITAAPRSANFTNREFWDGKDYNGVHVPAGAYMAELVTTDPYQCTQLKTSTVTLSFTVDMFRTVDVISRPLMGGASDSAQISFELSQTMQMDLRVYDRNTLLDRDPWPPAPALVGQGIVHRVEGVRPGRFRITEYWDGRNDNTGEMQPDGNYPFALIAYSSTSAAPIYSSDRYIGYITISRGKMIFTHFDVIPTIPTMYNSSDTVKLPPYEVDYSLNRTARVTIQVFAEQGARLVKTLVQDAVRDGNMLYQDFWNGKDENENFVTGANSENPYRIRAVAQDAELSASEGLNATATAYMDIDVYPLRIYDLAIIPMTSENPAVISYQVSEPMKVVTKIFKPGTPVTAAPAPGNASANEIPGSVVKRIIGVRPARTQISEYWDGTDLTLSKVPDGNYAFSIYASTMTNDISTINGALSLNAVLASDTPVSDIPLTQGGTQDFVGDFERDSFFAPNPYNGNKGWFRIPFMMNGWASLRIYNLAGDLVFKRDYGSRDNPRAAGLHVDGAGQCTTTQTHEACWPKVNSYGRTVAPGVYFAVIRFEATDGTRDAVQLVKKILIP